MRYYVCDPDFTNIRAVDVQTWGGWFENMKNRQVQSDHVELPRGRHAFVSTVFTGLDHNFTDEGPPVLFETMIFATGFDCNDDRWRATNVVDARGNHQVALTKARSAMPVGAHPTPTTYQ